MAKLGSGGKWESPALPRSQPPKLWKPWPHTLLQSVGQVSEVHQHLLSTQEKSLPAHALQAATWQKLYCCMFHMFKMLPSGPFLSVQLFYWRKWCFYSHTYSQSSLAMKTFKLYMNGGGQFKKILWYRNNWSKQARLLKKIIKLKIE